MNLDALRVFLQPDGFQPFDLKLANGDVHRIVEPYQMAVTKTQVVVLSPDSGLWVHCTPHQVVSVERVVPATETSAQASSE